MPIREGRQAIPVCSNARSTHSDPTTEDPGKYCAIANCCALRTTTVCLNPRPLKSVEFIQRSWHARQKNDMRNLSDPLHCLRWLHRPQYGLGRRSIQTVGANAYPTATVQTALLIRQIGGPRASRLLLCVMPAERTLMHAQMRHCVSPRSCSWHPPWTNKTAISVPQHAKFSLRDYRPHPARDEFTPLNSCSHLENSSDLGHLPGRPRTLGGRA